MVVVRTMGKPLKPVAKREHRPIESNMEREVPVDRIESVIEELSFPVIRSDAAVELADVTIIQGDKRRNLGELVSEADSDTYRSIEELRADIRTELGTENQ